MATKIKTNRLHPEIRKRAKSADPISYLNVPIPLIEERLQKRKSLLDQRIVEGYAVIWSSVNDYSERFVKGSFAKSISDLGPESTSSYKIKFRDRHGKSCGLFEVLKEDEIGLYFRTKPLDNVSWADDLITQLKSGTINNFSIGFRHLWDKVEWDEENDCMVVLEARLFEISAVDIPSDINTYALRGAEEIEYLSEDVEDFIDSLPKSKQLEARKIITRCLSLSKQEPDEKEIKPLKRREQKKTGVDYKLVSRLLEKSL